MPLLDLNKQKGIAYTRRVKILTFLLLAAIPAIAEDWTVNGKDYHNVTVGQVDADKVHITYDGGVGTILLSALSPDLQKKFNYDPVAAKAATHAQAQREAQSDQIVQKITQQQKRQQDLADAQAKLPLMYVKGTVFEKLPIGLLIKCPTPQELMYAAAVNAGPMASAGLGGSPVTRERADLSQPKGSKPVYGLCLLKNYPDQDKVVDGVLIKVGARSAGPYSYPATDGSTATVAAYEAVGSN